MPELPTGTLTLLFTDIEGSTRLLYALGERYPEVLATHRELLRAAFRRHGGAEVDTQGDAFFAVFARATQAVAAAIEAQRALSTQSWPVGGALRVRIGLHTGEPERTAEGYAGLDVHRGARITAAGHGGQVLLSEATATLVQAELPDDVTLKDLGSHSLKDLRREERLFQLTIADLPTDFPPLRSLESRPKYLPIQLTSFVEREREVAEVSAIVERAGVRLLTLTGAGGSGKTRLAIAVGERLLSDFRDGVWFVDLSALSDSALVPTVVAQVLAVQAASGRSVAEAIQTHLRPKQLLLILDNFEQLLNASDFLHDLLVAAPGLALLVTSRTVLRVPGEHEYTVSPLSAPAVTAGLSVEAIRESAAVRLFVQRAEAVQAGFALTPENAGAVAEICRRVDGLPLALELAAARIKLLPPQQLLARLGQSLKLLVGAGRGVPERQRTLRDTIRWSYDLLEEPERVLFRRLSTFAGGGSLEAAEASCNPDGDLDVLEGLTSLLDKSLLTQAEGPAGDPRFGMLATIRDFALDELRLNGEAETAQRSHAGYYLALAERGELAMRSEARDRWLTQLEQEHDNLRAALAWSMAQRESGDIGLRLACALWWFWWHRGHLGEGRAWLGEALGLVEATNDPTVRARTLFAAGGLAWAHGDYASARGLLEQSCLRWRTTSDRLGLAYAVAFWCLAAQFQSDDTGARGLEEEGVAVFRELGDRWGLALALHCLGNAVERLEPAAAKRYHEESLAIFRRVGDAWGIAAALNGLGELARAAGDYEQAAALYEEGLDCFRKAATGAVVDLYQTDVGGLLHNLGYVALHQGESGRARQNFQESLVMMQELGRRRGVALCLKGLASVAAAEGDCQHSATLFGAAEPVFDATGSITPPADQLEYDRHLSRVRAQLGDAAFATAWTAGQSMPLEQVIAMALDDKNLDRSGVG